MAERDDAIATLEAALSDPAQADKHDRIRAALAKARPVALGAPPEIAANQRAQAQVQEDDGPLARIGRGFRRMDKALETPAMLVNKAANAASGGLFKGGLDALETITGGRLGPTSEQWNRVDTDNPRLAMAAEFAGNVAPAGIPAKVGSMTARAADPLLRAILARTSTAPGRVAAKTLVGAGTAAASAAPVAAGRNLVEGGTPETAMEAAGQGAKVGAMVGGGLSAIGATGGEVAKSMRASNPDLQVLHRSGLEPGPVPGRPIIRQDQPVMSQLPGMTKPPLVGRVTPETRASAGRVAADEIVPDITARSKANNQRFGELKGQALAAEGSNPAPFQGIVQDIERRLADQSLPDATRKALGDVRAKFQPYLETTVNPELDAMRRAMQGASPPQRARLQASINQIQSQVPQARPFTARDLDEIRDYTDSKIKSGEISKGDVQFIQVADGMRRTLDQAAPGLARLNAEQSDILKGFGKRKALLGMKRSQRGEGEDVYEAVARRASEPGEETKAAGAKRGAGGSAIERASAMGPPPTLPGTANLPDDPGYQSLLNVPRLQLAQERMQLNPSSLFSGAGGTVGPMAAAGRLVTRAPARVIYPTARRFGDMELGGKPIAVDELTRAVRNRGKKKREEDEKRAAP